MNSSPATEPAACTRCQQLFLPPTSEPEAWIECPLCGARDTVAAFRAMPVPVALAPEPPRTPRRVLAALAIGAAAVLILTGLRWFLQENNPAEIASSPAPPSAFSPEETRDYSAAYEVAARALRSASMDEARPFLLQADAPLVDRYHAQHPWPTLNLARWTAGELLQPDSPRYLRLTVETERGQKLPLHLQETPEGWKLDWEALVNAPQFEWEEFCQQLPSEPRRLRVRMWRGSVTDEYLRAAHATADETVAARLTGPKPGDSVLALVPKNSEIGQTLQRDLTWEVPRRYIVELRCADAEAIPPRVEIIRLEREGWAENGSAATGPE